MGIATIAFISSCAKEGPAGADGTPGVDGDEVCMECHNVAKKAEVTEQWAESVHGIGAVATSRGGSQSCGMCHSDEGFRETQYTGKDTLRAPIGLPQAIQCQTCHDFHQSLDFTNERNYALRTMAPVELLMNRSVDPPLTPVTIDLGGSSNLCVSCHQPRRLPPNATDDSTRVTSTHYGPHYGTQSTSLAGFGAYELGTGYPAKGEGSAHATGATCTDCHMAEGSHTFDPTLAGCNTADCHDGAITSVDANARQTAFKDKMETLAAKLTTAGLLVDGSPNPGTYPTEQVGALWNYRWAYGDHSNGTHNFPYLETLIDNSIAVFP